LLAYLVWPTWEHGRVRFALADMLDAYRRYFCAVLDPDPGLHNAVRAASRSARSNAQASLDRLRGEPRRDRHLVTVAEGVFANANRIVRAAAAVEALRQNDTPVPARERVQDFANRTDAQLAVLAQGLRDGTSPSPDNSLRQAQRELAAELDAGISDDNGRLAAAAWADASDRITDAVDTLSYLLQRNGTHTARASG
jgi:uncharacterized membrane protein YccC